ncbi:MAG TPA: hypothetical protein VGM82_03500 [Gemmatimonadaceae bacterium]
MPIVPIVAPVTTTEMLIMATMAALAQVGLSSGEYDSPVARQRGESCMADKLASVVEGYGVMEHGGAAPHLNEQTST